MLSLLSYYKLMFVWIKIITLDNHKLRIIIDSPDGLENLFIPTLKGLASEKQLLGAIFGLEEQQQGADGDLILS